MLMEMFQGIPDFLWVAVGGFATAAIMAFVNHVLGRDKAKAEVADLISKSYGELITAYKEAQESMRLELSDLRGQQGVYLANSTELLKHSRELQREMDKLKGEHLNCHKKNAVIEKELCDLKLKLETMGSNG